MVRSERDDKKAYQRSNCMLTVKKWVASVIVDPRQILAGFLTVTMFVMLAHMIKREHFTNYSQVKLSTSTPLNDPFEESKFNEKIDDPIDTTGLWEDDAPALKSCWTKSSLEKVDQSEGYLTFSLTDGPEYHLAQIADAVVVARSIGATLVLPDIRGSKLGDKRDFGDVYDAKKFIKSLNGVVEVVKEPSTKISARNLAVVKVQAPITKDRIAEQIEPEFKRKGNVRLATYYPSVNMTKSDVRSEIDSVACMAMFGSLELLPEIRGVVDSMVDRLRKLSSKSDGHFIAVDLRVDLLEKKGCEEFSSSGSKSCFDASEVATFLRKIGYGKDTIIYLTEPRLNNSLSALKELFPKTYTKEGIMPTDKQDQFLDLEAPTLEDVIDFYICSESDVFVPAMSGLFYANVAGRRIASGKTQILVPTDVSSVTASPDTYISPYVTKKNHLAYSCFC